MLSQTGAVWAQVDTQGIELRVERNGVLVIYAGLIGLMWFVFMPMAPMQIANAILGIVCLAEFLKIVTGIRYLRKGMWP